MSIAEKLTTIAENEQRVYDSGYSKAENDKDLEIWNMITLGGTKTNWARTFQNLDFSNYEFIKPVAPKGDDICTYMFYDYKGKYLPKNLDFSGLNPSATISSMFHWASQMLQEIYDIGLPAMNSYSNVFDTAYNIRKIHILRVHKDSTFSNTFYSSSVRMQLEEITFDGVIGQNLNMSICPKLTYNTLLNIISCLYDYSAEGVTKTLTLHADAKARLTENDVNNITSKGWTLV